MQYNVKAVVAVLSKQDHMSGGYIVMIRLIHGDLITVARGNHLSHPSIIRKSCPHQKHA